MTQCPADGHFLGPAYGRENLLKEENERLHNRVYFLEKQLRGLATSGEISDIQPLSTPTSPINLMSYPPELIHEMECRIEAIRSEFEQRESDLAARYDRVIQQLEL